MASCLAAWPEVDAQCSPLADVSAETSARSAARMLAGIGPSGRDGSFLDAVPCNQHDAPGWLPKIHRQRLARFLRHCHLSGYLAR